MSHTYPHEYEVLAPDGHSVGLVNAMPRLRGMAAYLCQRGKFGAYDIFRDGTPWGVLTVSQGTWRLEGGGTTQTSSTTIV